MKFKNTLLLLIPALLCGCSSGEPNEQYQAINKENQDAIMDEIYGLHEANQRYLAAYSYQESISYDPTYDIFGNLISGDEYSINNSALLSYYEYIEDIEKSNAASNDSKQASLNSYFDYSSSIEIGVFSGYLIRKKNETTYIGNKEDAGSKQSRQETIAYWFNDFEEEGKENKKEIVRKNEVIENGISKKTKDTRQGVLVENKEIAGYFSKHIEDYYKEYTSESQTEKFFPFEFGKKTSGTAYYKSSNEIVEIINETSKPLTIQNPIHPGNEYKLTVLKQLVRQTTFKKIDKIGWVGTEYKEEVSYSLGCDYELQLLDSPHVIRKENKKVSFSYSTSSQPYSGVSYEFQDIDPKIAQYEPLLYSYDVDNQNYEKVDVVADDITAEYKRLSSGFNGYAYCFASVPIEEGKNYCFTTNEEVEESKYETIGFSNISENVLNNIVSSSIAEHDLFKTIASSETYQFIILVSQNNDKTLNKKVIARIC